MKRGFYKSKTAKRKVQAVKSGFSDKAVVILRTRLERFKGEYLFPKGERDGAEQTYQLNNQHRTVQHRTGLKFRLYDCRHTFATRVLESGVDLLTLASMLGHASLDEVMRYAHPSETRKSEAIQQLQNVKAKVN